MRGQTRVVIPNTLMHALLKHMQEQIDMTDKSSFATLDMDGILLINEESIGERDAEV